MQKIIKSYEYLFEKKSIHLHIKPENIFYTLLKNGQYLFKFGDFGLSKSIYSGRDTFGIHNQEYCAP